MSKYKRYSYHGEELLLSEIARRCGKSKQLLDYRIRKMGMSLDEAIDTPTMRGTPPMVPDMIEYHGQLYTHKEFSQQCGLNWNTIEDRMRIYGVSAGEAADLNMRVKQLYPYYGEMVCVSEVARRTGFSAHALFRRIRALGMTLEEAVEDMKMRAMRCKGARKRRELKSVHKPTPYPAPKPGPVPVPALYAVPVRVRAERAYCAMLICATIYGGSPSENGFAEVEPGSAWEFGSRHWRCRVEAQGDILELKVYFVETGKLSLSRRYKCAAGDGIRMIQESGHAGALYRRRIR